jgi:transcriptional regulator with XRE-family HTH domain
MRPSEDELSVGAEVLVRALDNKGRTRRDSVENVVVGHDFASASIGTDDLPSRFGKRVRDERERRGWSQEELAKRLTERGIPVYSSTIAKIEAEKKPRAARLGEAVAIADLFELSVDALLDRQGPDDSTLTFALAVLCDYAGDAERQIQRAREVTADIEDQLASVDESFDLRGIDGLRQAAEEMAEQLEAAGSHASMLRSIASAAIVEAPKEVPESGRGRRREQNR